MPVTITRKKRPKHVWCEKDQQWKGLDVVLVKKCKCIECRGNRAKYPKRQKAA